MGSIDTSLLCVLVLGAVSGSSVRPGRLLPGFQVLVQFLDHLVRVGAVDGAGHFRIYWSIALPNVKSSASTLLFMYFLWSWNDYEKPLLYLWDQTLYTMPLAVKAFSDAEAMNYPAIMAANVIMLLPIMIAFIACQKFFVESLVGSGVKG